MQMGFVPLHNHSDYSLLDGASQISKIVDRACDLGMDSIALTDHGVMYGVLDLVKNPIHHSMISQSNRLHSKITSSINNFRNLTCSIKQTVVTMIMKRNETHTQLIYIYKIEKIFKRSILCDYKLIINSNLKLRSIFNYLSIKFENICSIQYFILL